MSGVKVFYSSNTVSAQNMSQYSEGKTLMCTGHCMKLASCNVNQTRPMIQPDHQQPGLSGVVNICCVDQKFRECDKRAGLAHSQSLANRTTSGNSVCICQQQPTPSCNNLSSGVGVLVFNIALDTCCLSDHRYLGVHKSPGLIQNRLVISLQFLVISLYSFFRSYQP